jgi:dynein heavy chain, axonemal
LSEAKKIKWASLSLGQG